MRKVAQEAIPESTECQGCRRLYHLNVPKHINAVITTHKNKVQYGMQVI